MRKRHDSTHTEKGASLAKGPAWIVGSVLAVFGLILFFKAPGTPLTTDRLQGGQVQGVNFLGFEVNAWTAWLTTTAGVLVLIGVLQHVITKAMSLLVGLALGAAAVIALLDGSDVLGLAAANGFTALGWGIAAALLIIAALLPRWHHGATDDHHTSKTNRSTTSDAQSDQHDDRSQQDLPRQDLPRHAEPASTGDFRGDGAPPATQPIVRTGRFDRTGEADATTTDAGGKTVSMPSRHNR